MKWLSLIFIFFYIQSSAQTDTLSNAKAYSINYVNTRMYGFATNGHAYITGFRLFYGGAPTSPVSLPMDAVRVDLNTHTITAKTLSYTLSTNTFYWRSAMNSLGEWYTGFASGTRIILKLNMKDSIRDTNLGNGFYSGDNLAYSMSRGRDGNMYFGGSSSNGQSTDFSMVNYLTDAITMYHAPDDQDYTISTYGDTNFIYLQTGQGSFDWWSVAKATNSRKKLFTNGEFLINSQSLTGGIYAQYPYPTWSKMVDSTLLTQNPTGVTTDYTEFNGAAQPTINTFLDDSNGKLFWKINGGTTDSVVVTNSFQQSALRRVYADTYNKRFVNYLGDYYGIWYRYDTLLQTNIALGHVGINMFDAMQVAPNKWYFIGYPSSALVLWDSSLFWSAETFNSPLSASTNPKLIGQGRGTSDVHEPRKLIRLSNGLFCFGGDEIRTGNTVGFNWYDSTTNTLDGLNGDHFTPRQYSDIAAWGSNMILSTSATVAGKLFIFNGTTKTLTDSISPGFKNTGKIFIQGDRLYGIAQDTANATQTIDSTRFYIINLSTKTVVYNQKYLGTVNTCQLMPDGYIGINFTTRANPAAPLTNATLPTNFFALRRIDNLTYNYNGTNKYYGVSGLNMYRYSGITSAPIDINTYYGKYQTLINWLH